MSRPKIFLLLLVIVTIWGCQTPQSNIQESSDEASDDPSVQFSQDLTFLEPLSQKRLTDERFRAQKQVSDRGGIALPQIKPLELKGDIELSGNSDINSLNDLIYERFVQEGYSEVINFSGIYPSTAIKLFCEEGQFDILTLSRPMSDREIETCKSNDRQPIDFLIAKDAFVFVVNRQDTFVKNVTLSRLWDLFQVDKWSDVNSNWPDEPIERLLILPRNFLFDSFPELAFQGEGKPIINLLNTNFYKFYQPLSQDLSTTRYGVGYLSYPYYQRNSQSLRVIPIEGHVANAETVQSGAYPFGYSIFLYADLNQLQQKSQVSSFINFYLTHVNQEIDQAGYLPVSEQELNNSKSSWLKAMEIDN